ncbi:MAG TPA: hypothetical protein VKV05_14250 [Terriglobales bacterium]|nr:hypothetical protein [Terriglobales bacterium]
MRSTSSPAGGKMFSNEVRTEVRGLSVRLDGSELVFSADGNDVIALIPLVAGAAERLRLEMAKAQLPEWNLLEEAKSQAELRSRRHLGSWLVMCLAAFSAYLGYPNYELCLFLAALSIALWWWAGYAEKQAESAAQAERSKFRAEWDYLQQRLEELNGAAVDRSASEP